MKLVILFGPQAVGKMTVGQELAKQTGFKLFHNHMTIDLVSNFFDYGTVEGKRLVSLFRQEIFEAVAESDLPGLIFTYVWAFDMREDWAYIESLYQLFRTHGAEVYFVELLAEYAVRFERNKTPNRLANKPTKRDLVRSEAIFCAVEKKYRLNSMDGEVPYPKYLRIDNTTLAPEAAAAMISDHFAL